MEVIVTAHPIRRSHPSIPLPFGNDVPNDRSCVRAPCSRDSYRSARRCENTEIINCVHYAPRYPHIVDCVSPQRILSLSLPLSLPPVAVTRNSLGSRQQPPSKWTKHRSRKECRSPRFRGIHKTSEREPKEYLARDITMERSIFHEYTRREVGKTTAKKNVTRRESCDASRKSVSTREIDVASRHRFPLHYHAILRERTAFVKRME